MNSPARRRARLLRLRSIELRIAAVRTAEAEAAQASVLAIAQRVAGLRAGLGTGAGLRDARDLQGQSALADRLDQSRPGLDSALQAAIDVRNACFARQQAARLAEERAGRIHASAVRQETDDRERRAAAAIPPRRAKAGAAR